MSLKLFLQNKSPADKKLNKKSLNSVGQMSIEFIVIFIVLFLLFVFTIYVGHEKNSTLLEQEKSIGAQNIVSSLGNIINQVSLMANGAEKTITLNNKFEYGLSVNNYKLYLVIPISNSTYGSQLVTNDVNISATEFESIVVKKINDSVVVEDAS
ncbi:MAG: hypothetical protein COT55_02215 [Candidatus Diapherotrites archaeon CG09_land_8_20_14_0_10_32_12]|nr:MAG: hypothetical protein COT55_02215 [Candidatus Diapherotrites archaeon CG09_land_8_20_14_0_10_32_12]